MRSTGDGRRCGNGGRARCRAGPSLEPTPATALCHATRTGRASRRLRGGRPSTCVRNPLSCASIPTRTWLPAPRPPSAEAIPRRSERMRWPTSLGTWSLKEPGPSWWPAARHPVRWRERSTCMSFGSAHRSAPVFPGSSAMSLRWRCCSSPGTSAVRLLHGRAGKRAASLGGRMVAGDHAVGDARSGGSGPRLPAFRRDLAPPRTTP
jgi:hypothetical protein